MTKSSKYSLERFDREFINSIQIVIEKDDIQRFINDVVDAKNYSKEERLKLVKQSYFSYFHEKSVAETLLDKIIEGIEEEERIRLTEREIRTGSKKFIR